MIESKKTMMRIGTVLLLSIIIWRFILYFNNILIGNEYNRVSHFLIAGAITILSFIFINAALRIDKIPWYKIGMKNFHKNIISFLVGMTIWAVPAAIGLIICLEVGWVDITVKTADSSQLLMSILILFITVFLMEAFPEELIFRGYVYSYVNSLFPHWITLIIQTLIFSSFAYLIGAMYSLEQILFIPGFGFMLGYFRAKSGNIWTSIGFHVAIMTATQIFSPMHNHFDITGAFVIRFFAFNLLPYVLGAIALEFIYPKHNWGEKVLIKVGLK